MPQKPKDNEQCSLCGRWDNRPVGVDTVVVKDGRVLMLKRSTNPDAGMYALPGGYLDRGESAEQAALREVKEETGLRVEIIKFIGARSDPSRYRQIVELGFIGKVTGGREVPGDGAERLDWFKLEDLPSNISMDHGEIIKNAIPFLKELDLING